MTNLPGPTGSAVATEDSRKGDGCKGSTDPACYDHTGNVGIGPVQVCPERLGIAISNELCSRIPCVAVITIHMIAAGIASITF